MKEPPGMRAQTGRGGHAQMGHCVCLLYPTRVSGTGHSGHSRATCVAGGSARTGYWIRRAAPAGSWESQLLGMRRSFALLPGFQSQGSGSSSHPLGTRSHRSQNLPLARLEAGEGGAGFCLVCPVGHAAERWRAQPHLTTSLNVRRWSLSSHRVSSLWSWLWTCTLAARKVFVTACNRETAPAGGPANVSSLNPGPSSLPASDSVVASRLLWSPQGFCPPPNPPSLIQSPARAALAGACQVMTWPERSHMTSKRWVEFS